MYCTLCLVDCHYIASDVYKCIVHSVVVDCHYVASDVYKWVVHFVVVECRYVLFQMNRDEDGSSPDDPTLNMELLYAVHDALKTLPSIIHKTVLKSIINALLEENRM
uniref:Uncharacterized protein n=1 Tax=Timema poppense TaxID=170557 RepID=A0A7R9DY13_TIMPO|nr:unnamed protein product [Timema poppensis]